MTYIHISYSEGEGNLEGLLEWPDGQYWCIGSRRRQEALPDIQFVCPCGSGLFDQGEISLLISLARS